jgi:low temperature requirement protein LtrA
MTIPVEVEKDTERNASTLELFFDLVFVFAITQVVAFVHHDPTVTGFAQGALLLWLLWWTWSNYTWTTNWTGTDTVSIKMVLLGAMGATLLMALVVPDAFGEASAWFGLTYFVVRTLAAGFYFVASNGHKSQREAFFKFFPISIVASGLVLIGGFLSQPWLGVFWVASAAIDIVSAANAGKAAWDIDAKHFAERNGLFIIIALGESVVAIGLTAAGAERDLVHLTALVASFVGVAALWWSYFDRAAVLTEAHFKTLPKNDKGRFARDAYSILHYPLVVGIVFYAVAAEDVVSHPSDPLSPQSRFAMATGAALVMLSIVASAFRAVRRVPQERLVAAVSLIALAAFGDPLEATWFAALVAAILVIALSFEHRRWKRPVEYQVEVS